MSPRTCRLLIPALALLAAAGCHHSGCKKPTASCPPAPPPGATFVAPPPGGAPGFPGAAPGEILTPAPLPPSGAAPVPTAPPPTFPPPSASSGFPPVASFYPPPAAPPKPSAAGPPIKLLPPEGAAPAAGLSESSSAPAASAAPAGVPEFSPAIPGRVAVGRKPTLDGLDWLKANGYRSVLFLRGPGASDAADRKQFEQRGLTFASLEVSPASLSLATVEAFARSVGEPSAQPLFVYDADGSLAGGLWYLYFRRVERLPDEAARRRAARLGLRDAADGPHRDMALAVQRLLAQA